MSLISLTLCIPLLIVAGFSNGICKINYDHLSEAQAKRGIVEATSVTIIIKRGDPELMEYEALNLVDGKRSITEINDILNGRYVSIPLSFVAARFERLAPAGIINWK